MMDLYEQPPIEQDLVATPEDSESKPISHRERKLAKTKPIQKKNISKTMKIKSSESPQQELSNSKNDSTIAPFSLFETDHQKYKRLEIYFRQDIQNYYRNAISSEQIRSLNNTLNENFISLKDVLKKDLVQIWGKNGVAIEQMLNYLNLIQKCEQYQNNYTLFQDKEGNQHYCAFSNGSSQIVYQLRDVQAHFLRQRRKFIDFLHQFKSSEKPYQTLQLSPITRQILFLLKNLYIFTKQLKDQIQKIYANKQFLDLKESTPSHVYEDQYSSFLISKLMLDSFQVKDIDYLNFFKNNERVENGNKKAYDIKDQKDFDEFLKKKKSKKGKKSKGSVLHTACLGCFSSYHEQYNPFLFCFECGARFHRFCFAPKEQGLCQNCYVKKVQGIQKSKIIECDYCPLKDLLFMPKNQSDSNVHVFCMLVHGLWKVEEGKLKFDKNKESNLILEEANCSICQGNLKLPLACVNCNKKVHASCAFLSGWDFMGKVDENNMVQVRIRCCENVCFSQNSKYRKFIANYKKQAYLF